MAYRGEQLINGKTYVYEAVATWNPDKKRSEQKRVYIGVKNAQGEFVPNKKYCELYLNKTSEKQEIGITKIVEYGNTFLFEHIGEQIGLTKVLQESFPDTWQEILTCSWHCVSEHEAMYLCEQWAQMAYVPDGLQLSSQRLSDLLISLDENSRMNFYRKWAALRSEKEYLALDITSISSYSELIQYVEYGYNRDKEKLPQINLGMVFGEKTRLPVYCRAYPGSIKDVTTLMGMTEIIKELNLKSMHFVMDKGFYSENAVKRLLNERIKYAIAVPFTTSFAKTAVLSCTGSITNPQNAIEVNGHVYYAQTFTHTIHQRRVYLHVYFNQERRTAEQTAFMHKMLQLESDFIDGKTRLDDRQLRKYFTVRETKSGVTIRRNRAAIENHLKMSGYFVVMTNDNKDPQYILQIYRTKDCVEKAFENIKNDLDMKRLRIHSDSAMQGRIFITFIALILSSHIRYKMKEANLYRRFTFLSLIKELKKLKIVCMSNQKTILTELTHSQKRIFKAFKAMPSIP